MPTYFNTGIAYIKVTRGTLSTMMSRAMKDIRVAQVAVEPLRMLRPIFLRYLVLFMEWLVANVDDLGIHILVQGSGKCWLRMAMRTFLSQGQFIGPWSVGAIIESKKAQILCPVERIVSVSAILGDLKDFLRQGGVVSDDSILSIINHGLIG